MSAQLKDRLVSIFRDIRADRDAEGRLTVVAGAASVRSVLKLFKEEGYDFLQLVSCVDWIDQGELEVVYVLSSYPVEGDGPEGEEAPVVSGSVDSIAHGVGRQSDGGDVEAGAHGSLPPVVLKTRVPRESPVLETAIGVYPVAEPYEREIHELYGVSFEGHPRLTPLFLEREYEIPPFRKDFDTRKYVDDVFGSVPPVGEEDQGQ